MQGTTALGKYKLLRPLGCGSNAEVFLAEPLRQPTGRVVVKRIHDHVAKHPKFRQLFEAEVRSMANFSHPYAVRLLDAAVDDPIGPCLVMEYVPGVTLETLLEKFRRITPDRVARLLGYFCHALQAAHDAGIIHRDLKPANLMVVNAGQPTESIKVMDFGFAGFVAQPHIQLAELTGHGPIYAIGTPGYVSPEMIRGDRVDTRSDLYSVGVILFEMMTGRLPFEHDNVERLLAAHVKETPPKFHRIGCAYVPPGVEAVVQLALSKYPNERQQTAREVAEAFGNAAGEKSLWQLTTPAGWEPPPRAPVCAHHAPPPTDPFRVSSEFEVSSPERLIAAKIRGFVEDVDAKVLASEPGLIRLQVGVSTEVQKAPATGSSIFMWMTALRKPTVTRGQEPIQVELHMEKPNPALPQLRVAVACGPVTGYLPQSLAAWRERCDKLHVMIRQYLGG